MHVGSVRPQTGQPASVGADVACKSPGHVMGCCSQSSPSQHTQAEAEQHQSRVFLAVQRLHSGKKTNNKKKHLRMNVRAVALVAVIVDGHLWHTSLSNPISFSSRFLFWWLHDA